MSNSVQPTSSEPSDNRVFLSAIGWLGVFLLFALIVIIAFSPNRSKSFYEETTETRLTIKSEVDAAQSEIIETYAWVNEAEGVVRIPVEKAKEITITELKVEQTRLSK